MKKLVLGMVFCVLSLFCAQSVMADVDVTKTKVRYSYQTIDGVEVPFALVQTTDDDGSESYDLRFMGADDSDDAYVVKGTAREEGAYNYSDTEYVIDDWAKAETKGSILVTCIYQKQFYVWTSLSQGFLEKQKGNVTMEFKK